MKSIRTRAPNASSSTVRRIMQRIKSSDTNPEKLMRSLLFKSGLRFRKNYQPVKHLKIKCDIAFTKSKLCLFIDGCFWHGCPKHYKVPKTNSEWWEEKIGENIRRDARQTKILQEHNWCVIRIYEHDLTADRIDRVLSLIQRVYWFRHSRNSLPIR